MLGGVAPQTQSQPYGAAPLASAAPLGRAYHGGSNDDDHNYGAGQYYSDMLQDRQRQHVAFSGNPTGNIAGSSSRSVSCSSSSSVIPSSTANHRNTGKQPQQPEPYAWAKPSGSSSSSSSSSSSYANRYLHHPTQRTTTDAASIGDPQRHQHRGTEQRFNPQYVQEGRSADSPISTGTWEMSSYASSSAPQGRSGRAAGGAGSVQDFWRQQHQLFNVQEYKQ